MPSPINELPFVEAMRTLESNCGLRSTIALALVLESEQRVRAGLKLLRLDSKTDSRPFFPADERAIVTSLVQVAKTPQGCFGQSTPTQEGTMSKGRREGSEPDEFCE